MKVTSFNPQKFNNIDRYRKENHFYKQLTLINLNTAQSLATVRFYQPGEVCYCCVWFSGFSHARGADKAGGGGYHKESAAMDGALHVAGFRFDKRINACGDGAMRDALHALAKYAGLKKNYMIHEAHS